jgi:hypothetical protein
MTGESTPTEHEGEMYDAPNQQAVGLDPPWVEGTGGEPGDATPSQEAVTAGPDAPQGSSADLDSMTKEQLLEHARQVGAKPANAAMSKEELRRAIDEREGDQNT